MKFFDLTGKVAIVSGGNSGIGFAIARGLAIAGSTVVIANRTADEGQKAADSLTDEGYQAMAVRTDVSDKSSVSNLVKTVIDELNKLIFWSTVQVLLPEDRWKILRRTSGTTSLTLI